MKKFLLIALPILAVIIVAVFGYNWYKQRTAERLSVPEVTAGTEIEELSTSELAALENLRRGVGDYQSVKMTGSGVGEVRYEIKDGKVLFSVNANLPTDQEQIYHLWLKEAQATDFVQSKILEDTKGGLIASSAVAIDKLPIALEIRVGETVILRGEIQAEN